METGRIGRAGVRGQAEPGERPGRDPVAPGCPGAGGYPASYFPIGLDHLMGCNHLGHSWDEHGDCRHCPANQDDEKTGSTP